MTTSASEREDIIARDIAAVDVPQGLVQGVPSEVFG
jgi:hypothetical protein